MHWSGMQRMRMSTNGRSSFDRVGRTSLRKFRYCWGYFTIQAYVILKAGYSWVSNEAEDSPDGASKGMLSLEWTLDFNGFGGKGSMGRCRLKVKNDRDWEDISEEGEQDEAEMRRLVRQYERDGRYQPPEED